MKQLVRFKYEVLLALSVIVFIAFFSYLSIRRNLSLSSHYYDLGIMNQTVENTKNGHFLEMTDQDLKKNVSRLAVHFDPILAFFAPLYFIYDGPETLLVAQIIIIGLGAVAVYMIAHHLLSKKLYAFIFALSYLLYFPIERAILFDFHAVVLSTTFLLFALYFGLVRRHGASLIFIVLSLLTKENVGLVTFLYGFYLIFFRKERLWGSIISIVSLLFFAGSFFVVIPYLRQYQNHFALRYYGDFGDSPKQIALSIFLNPITTVKHLLTYANARYIFGLLFAHSLFILFSPITFLIALPEFALNLLSSNPNMKSIYFHYNSLLVPFIIFSSISGFSTIMKRYNNKKIHVLSMSIFVGLSFIQIYFFNPLPLPFLKEPYAFYPINHQKLTVLHNWQHVLQNEDIKVSTTPRLAPFFTNRRYYYNFLFDPAYPSMGKVESDILKRIDNYTSADYLVLDMTEFTNEGQRDLLQKFYSHLKNNPSFKMIYKDGDIEVYKKQA